MSKVKFKKWPSIITFIIYALTELSAIFLMTNDIIPDSKLLLLFLLLVWPLFLFYLLFKFCYYTDDGTSPAKIAWAEIKQSEAYGCLYGAFLVFLWLGISAGLIYWGYKLDNNIGGILQWVGLAWAGVGYLLLMGEKK